MKKIIQKMASVIAIVAMLLSVQMSYAQSWQWWSTGNTYGYSDANTSGIGIGNFGSTNISSALHVNTNLTAAQSGGFAAGQVFRTEGNP